MNKYVHTYKHLSFMTKSLLFPYSLLDYIKLNKNTIKYCICI